MARLTSELVVRLLDQVTKPARAAAMSIKGIADARDRAEARMDQIRGRMVDAVGAGYALQAAISAPITAAVEFESSMADVRKVVDFATPAAFQKMGEDIRAMSLEMPMAADGIAQIVAAAGQSGVANEDLLKFTRMAAQVGVAWDVAAGEAGEALAKLQTATGRSVEDTGLLADAINHLGNKSAASAPEILNMVRRVAGSAETFGITTEQAAAFGAAMIGAGFESEVAATSFLNMGKALTRGGSATERQAGAMGKLGLGVVDVAKSMQKDALGTIEDVLKRLSKMPDYMRASLMSDIFGDEARALTPLIVTQGLLEKTLGYVADEATYAGSALNEYKVRAETTANSMQLFRNRLNNLGITIGSALIPALNDIMGALAPVIAAVTRFAEANPVLTRNVIAATAALVGFRVAMVGMQWALGFSSLSLLNLGAAMAGLGGKAAAAGALAATPFTKLGTHIAGVWQTAAFRFQMMSTAIAAGSVGLAGTLQGTFATAARAIYQLLAPLALVRGAMVALKFAVIGTGIGAVLVGIAAAGAFIYNNWSGITTMFEAFKGAFARAIEPIRPALEPVIGLFSRVGEAWSALTGRVDPLGGQWAAMGISIGKSLGGALVSVVEAGQRALTFIQSMPEKLAAIPWGDVTAELIAQFVAIPVRIATIPVEILGLFTGIDLGGAARTMIATFIAGVKNGLIELGSYVKSKLADMFTFNVTMPSWLGGGGGASGGAAVGAAANSNRPPVDGARARGGPVEVGKTYLVGENEPEYFTPHADGFITPMSEAAERAGGAQAASMPAGQASPRGGGKASGGRTSSFSYAPTYHIRAGMDDAALRAALEQHDRAAEQRFAALMDGAFADS